MRLPSRPKVLLATLLALVAALAATASPASASGGIVVNVGGCAFGTGTANVPSGEDITLHGYATVLGSYGQALNYVSKQHTTLTISDAASEVFDLSNQYSGPTQLDRNLWGVRLPDTDLGISLASGQSILATYDATFQQPVLVAYPPVGPSGDNGPGLLQEDGPFSCLITAT
jgi:hypothetical protein